MRPGCRGDRADQRVDAAGFAVAAGWAHL